MVVWSICIWLPENKFVSSINIHVHVLAFFLCFLLLTGIAHVSQQLLVLSGDVELNPGPKHGGELGGY